MQGLVLQKQSDKFLVLAKDKQYILSSRKKNKDEGVFVGDYVEFDEELLVIQKVLERGSVLLRPNLANLQKLFVVIAPVPKPDFGVVDKLVLFALYNNIQPILVVNKTDICSQEFLQDVKRIYQDVMPIVFTSVANNSGKDELRKQFDGHICALAGQSAVGKSALINMIYPQSKAVVGMLSHKIQRGKNTTRSAKLYPLDNHTFLADTPGFSSLDILYLPIKYFELCYYYPDFLKYHQNCKYKSCTHTKEPTSECAIKQMVECGKIDLQRYNRYKTMFEILQKHWTKNHG